MQILDKLIIKIVPALKPDLMQKIVKDSKLRGKCNSTRDGVEEKSLTGSYGFPSKRKYPNYIFNWISFLFRNASKPFASSHF